MNLVRNHTIGVFSSKREDQPPCVHQCYLLSQRPSAIGVLCCRPTAMPDCMFHYLRTCCLAGTAGTSWHGRPAWELTMRKELHTL